MFDAQTSALAGQDLGCLAPSARHLCSTGPTTGSSSVRSGIFWNGRKMSLLAELIFPSTHNSTYMPALTGLRLNSESGQIKAIRQKSNRIQTDLNRKSCSARPAWSNARDGRQGGRLQRPFKIKKPSQNARKIGKVMQGNASVFDPPPGGGLLSANPTGKRTRNPLFSTNSTMFQRFVSCRFCP